jgi:N-ethylmaleimide reductase
LSYKAVQGHHTLLQTNAPLKPIIFLLKRTRGGFGVKNSRMFEPLSFGKLHLKNRIAMAPMTRGRAGKERVPGDLMAEYYFQRAGAGLLITEATVISKQGIGWIDSPGIFTDAMVEGWQKVTEKVKPTGTPIFLQLWHCGRASHSDFHDGNLPVSASAVKLNGDHIHTPLGSKPYETPRSLSVDEIKATVNDYRKAAENAKAAGFSGVEVHGANGYLINKFLDATTNHREDQYGGSFENRFRFFREVLEAVLEVWPSDQVGARISPNGVFNDMGCDDYRELFLYVTKEINKLKLGYLHIMDGLAFGFHEKGEPMTLAEFRPLFKGIIIGNCGYTKETAEERIAEGNADIIAIGRPFITNPDLPERYRNNWPLNPAEDMSLWYTPGPEGYTDYTPHKP